MKRPLAGLWAAWMLSVVLSRGAQFGWNFESLAPTLSGDPQGLQVGELQRANNHGSTALLSDAMASAGYEGASGGQHAAAAARTGPLSWDADGSAYFEFAVTPGQQTHARLQRLALGSRVTASGPRWLALYSNLDGFAAPLAPPVWVPATGEWLRFEWTLDAAAIVGTRFRLVGYGGEGAASPNIANWRIDDLEGVLEIVPGDLPPPRGLTSSNATADGFDCAWEPAAGAAGYRLSLFTIVTSGEWPDLVEDFEPVPGFEDRWVSDASVRLEGLVPKTTYYWQVRTAGAESISEPSELSEMTTLASTGDPDPGPERPVIQALELLPGGDVRVAIESLPGHAYRLEYRTSGPAQQPGEEPWQSVGEPVDGTGGRVWLLDPSGLQPRRFFRVRAAIAP